MREEALAIDLEGIEVHDITRGSFETSPVPVTGTARSSALPMFGKAEPEPFWDRAKSSDVSGPPPLA